MDGFNRRIVCQCQRGVIIDEDDTVIFGLSDTVPVEVEGDGLIIFDN